MGNPERGKKLCELKENKRRKKVRGVRERDLMRRKTGVGEGFWGKKSYVGEME